MQLTELYQIDGKAMPVPDADVEMTFSDLDAADSGRDESGVMHRIVVRNFVPAWEFCYSVLTAEEYRYIRNLLAGKTEFTFTYPDVSGKSAYITAYCSGGSIVYHDSALGLYKNLKLKIIAC